MSSMFKLFQFCHLSVKYTFQQFLSVGWASWYNLSTGSAEIMDVLDIVQAGDNGVCDVSTALERLSLSYLDVDRNANGIRFVDSISFWDEIDLEKNKELFCSLWISAGLCIYYVSTGRLQ